MTSILNNENAKENNEPIEINEGHSEVHVERDNIMNGVSRLPSNGGQLSRVIPDNVQAPVIQTIGNVNIPSDNSPQYNDKSPMDRNKRLTSSLERGNTEKALLNFNN